MTPLLFTIGVYGSDEGQFFDALVKHQIDTFCDIRLRRGMRGSRYAFVKSTALQQQLQIRGVRYIHRKDLAPSAYARSQQRAEDVSQAVAKRDRTRLSAAFIRAYEAECLSSFDGAAFMQSLGLAPQRVVLFCVERHPDACHRSLIARRLEHDLGLQVEHILP